MEVYNQIKVKKARALRRQGLSFGNIAKKLFVSETTVRTWCLDIPGQNVIFKVHQKMREKIKNSEKDIVKGLFLSKDLAKIFTSLLYWGEGTKYPNSAAVSFSNSDPTMVVTFVGLLRKAFELDENRFKIHLQLHTTHDRDQVFSYWSRLLKIPKNQFWKPTITKPTKKMKRRNYLGTCTVRYHDYKILLKLMGIYETFYGEVAEWLKAAHC